MLHIYMKTNRKFPADTHLEKCGLKLSLIIRQKRLLTLHLRQFPFIGNWLFYYQSMMLKI